MLSYRAPWGVKQGQDVCRAAVCVQSGSLESQLDMSGELIFNLKDVTVGGGGAGSTAEGGSPPADPP